MTASVVFTLSSSLKELIFSKENKRGIIISYLLTGLSMKVTFCVVKLAIEHVLLSPL